ncbi:DNA/RNA non-specific endonuclease [Aquabacterium humicola]|uniref:DNA/RNA non-specific endonuclease n=1 Tax=Aquabacterium humicola TaxID=3237377 RepID=UPI00254308C2|nr:DNA/RNA non-specific endonuclease [Rubrivivax pictus]
MKINEDLLRASEARARALDATTPLLDPPPRPTPDVKEVKRRLTYYGLGENTPTPTEFERAIDGNDLVDGFYLERALRAADPVCRIVLRSASGSERGHATGFMVAPGVMLTNWHVFQDGMDPRHAIAEFNYSLDIRGDPVESVHFRVRPDILFLDDKDLDYAFVGIQADDETGRRSLSRFGFHRLIPETGKAEEHDWLTIIQHPEGQRRQFAIRENKLVRKEDGQQTLWYRSDTARGSSGAPVFNDSLQVVALHHMGVAPRDDAGLYVLKDGSKVASLRGIDDEQVEWIANEGIRVSALCRHVLPRLRPTPIDQGLREAIAGRPPDLIATVLNRSHSPAPAQPSAGPVEANLSASSPAPNSPRSITMSNANNEAGVLVVPIELRISVGIAGAVAAQQPAGVAAPLAPDEPLEQVERYVKPWFDDDYDNRATEGYNADFLGVPVPLPTVVDPSTAASYDGKHFIPYVHFSLCVHRKRRLAILAASNVDYREAMRKPDSSRKYDRDSLGGLGKNDLEAWLTDPRLGELHQIPDEFYSNDRGAFDRGHIVRRDDVCWGSSYDEVRRANGDTYHLTNCSPQVAHYNQSQKNGVWGLLEEVVKDNAKAEQLSVFAGCVLRDEDKYFTAKYKNQDLKFKVPASFWKVVVARGTDGKLQAYGFVLEQDLSSVSLTYEFSMHPSWREYMYTLKEIEAMTGDSIAFDPVLHLADQADTAGGHEVLRRAGILRARPQPATAVVVPIAPAA